MPLQSEKRQGNTIRGTVDLDSPDQTKSFLTGTFEAGIK